MAGFAKETDFLDKNVILLDSKSEQRWKRNEELKKEKHKFARIRKTAEIEQQKSDFVSRTTQLNFSTRDAETTEESPVSYYCAYCARFCLVASKELSSQPQRGDAKIKTLVLDSLKITFSIDADRGDTAHYVLNESKDGYEKRNLYNCIECKLPFCYRLDDYSESFSNLFVYADSLCDDYENVISRIKKI